MRNEYKFPKQYTLSTRKEFVSYTYTNIPFPPLEEVPTKRFSI